MSIEKLRETTFSPVALEWFESKGIEFNVLSYAGIYTQEFEGETWVTFPCYDEKGEIANNRMGTLRNGKLVDIERLEDGRDMFYNMQALELAVKENKTLVVCQREMDVLSFLQAGYAWVIGFVQGDDLLWDSLSKFKGLKKIILAGYANEAGKKFNNHVSHKLGLGRCAYIELPDGCVSVNDVLIRGGNLNDLIITAKHYPVVGLCKPQDFPKPLAEDLKTYSTGYGPKHDHHIKLMLGKLMIVTGIPGHGKSAWTDGLVMNLARLHNWPVCVFSTEIRPDQYEKKALKRILGKPIANSSRIEIERALDFYNRMFVHITNRTMDEDLELNIDTLVDLMEIACLRHECKVFLIDPWNEIEHVRHKTENETEYVGRALKKIKRFAAVYGVLVVVAAHPKMPANGQVDHPPTLYSIAGSANWYNKMDYGIIIWREDISQPYGEVKIRKIKEHEDMGWPGDIEFTLNKQTERLEEI